MKKILLLLLLPLLLASCATTKNTTLDAMNNAMVGQNEMTIFKLLGAPSNVTHTADGGKVMVYEQYNRGEFIAPDNSSIGNSNNTNRIGEKQGISFTSNANKTVNSSSNTVYQTSISYLKVHIDKTGKCTRLENTLSQEQLEAYHKRFK